MLVLSAKINSWERLARRWWWLGLPPLVLMVVLGVIEWQRHREFVGAERAYQQDRLRDAQELIQSYLAARPNHFEAHLLAARLDRLLGSYAGAENHLNECKRLTGMSGDLQLEWLLLRAVNGDFPAVEKDLKLLLADDDPRSSLILETLVHCYLGVLRYNSAMDYLQSWLKREPDNIRALDLRAFVCERLENRDQAMLDYGRVLELSPGTRHARQALVEILLADKNLQEAAEHLQILRQYPAPEPGELLALARSEVLQGKPEEARQFLDDLLAQKPDHIEALYERGMLTEDPAEAEGYFRKALAGNETFLQARYQLFSALLKQGRKEDAEAEKNRYKAIEKDLRSLPNLLVEADRYGNPDLLARAAAILMRGMDYHQGTQLLYRALHLNPNHRPSHEMLADYFEKTKQPEKAARHRQKARLKSP